MKKKLKLKQKEEEKKEDEEVLVVGREEAEMSEVDMAIKEAEELVNYLDNLYESNNPRWRRLKFSSGLMLGETLGDLVNAIVVSDKDSKEARRRMKRAGEGIVEMVIGTLLGLRARENEASRKGLFK